MDEIFKELQGEIAELKQSLSLTLKLNEQLVGTVEQLRNDIEVIKNTNINKDFISEEDKMMAEVMKGLGLI